MNVLILFEIVIALISLFFLFYNFSLPSIDLKEYIAEDILASLNSINYWNFTETKVCDIIKELIDYYWISINNVTVCKNTNVWNRELFYIYTSNGSIYIVDIKYKI